ncbi:hypothetical protein EK21DRAFT_86777 [Setomelanomma holmii]|uniref:MYND-type domain-containing protein n=1 Tax=Setomelanomma holmii TaxID=210430 RepID=A0A9P4LQ05_9PLEO|nr:hypothetical protein EK21DRAFT_86777 [Setomelanomma holmii]
MSSTWLNPPMCANIQDGVQCTNDADRFVYSRCRLVQYCSKECKAAHWRTHKIETCKHPMNNPDWKPEWFTDRRAPPLTQAAPGSDYLGLPPDTKHIWGNMPAIDILQVEKNDGEMLCGFEIPFGIFVASIGLQSMLAQAGLKMRGVQEHTITRAWPRRMTTGGS